MSFPSAEMTTESSSNYDSLECMSTTELLTNINTEDQKVPIAVNAAIPAISNLVEAVYNRMKDNQGGRLFYIGAGTSGRLGIVDASECPPTYGIPHGVVIGIIAGGDGAIRKAVEKAEDSFDLSWDDLKSYDITPNDCVVGIAASGRTPYVIGGLNKARELGCVTGCIVCNSGSAVADACEYPVEVVVGPEFVTGSTRMKSGTAQKLVLNMLSTSLMIRLGHVKGNSMVDMALSNEKLVGRGVKMVRHQYKATVSGTSEGLVDVDIMHDVQLQELLLEHGSVRACVDHLATLRK